MKTITRKDIWSVEVHFYPSAAKAGLTPCGNQGYHPEPQFYNSHKFLFANIPKLEDFLLVCKQNPWTSIWDGGLQPMLNEKMWGELPIGKKAYTISLLDDGLIVGHLDISRESIYTN